MLRISFLVITLNRSDKLRRCLTSLQAMTYAHKEIWVLNNGSTDNTADMLVSDFGHSDIHVVNVPENIGAGSGRNMLARHAAGDVCVFMDDDTYSDDPNMGDKIASYFSGASSEKTVVVFSILDETGALFTNYIPRFDKTPQAEDTPCTCLMAGGFAIRKQFFDQTGGFWPRLDPYGYEDRELGFRLLAQGAQMLWSRHIAIHHDKEEDPNVNPRWMHCMLPHHGWVAIRHLPWRYVLSYLAHGWPYFGLKAIRYGLMGAYLRSVWIFFRHLPEVLRERRVLPGAVLRQCKAHSGRLRY